MKDVIKKFNETNKDNIEVEMTVLADNYNQSVDIAFASNQAPDILRTNDFLGFVKKGYLQPINDMMTDEMKKRYDNLLGGRTEYGGWKNLFPASYRAILEIDL